MAIETPQEDYNIIFSVHKTLTMFSITAARGS